ncbi:ATP phosphoribosyltransferase regulatory subunit [Thermaurantiacus sp.]
MEPALLPEGFRDRLPPEAEAGAHLLRTVIDVVAAHGYERVQPPLAEYEDNLARWLAGSASSALVRASDPATGRGLALRPDITGQIARIASTRMADAPRPLRLAYGGPVLRARGSEIDPARERTQAGAELIGHDGVAAVGEVLGLALEALEACAVEAISIDLTLPGLVPALAKGPWPVSDPAAVAIALDGKDWGALEALGAAPYRALLEASGDAGAALARLRSLNLPVPVMALFEEVAALVALLDGVRITIDPTERHGFEYQSWIGFSLFGEAAGLPFRTEIGRGGSYAIRRPDGSTEPAAGFSLYVDPLAEAGLGQAPTRRLFLPAGTPADIGRQLRSEGYQTVAGLLPSDTAEALRCAFRWDGVRVVEAG